MNKAQKEVQQAQLDDEKKVIKLLEAVYDRARKDCEQKIKELSARTDLENLQSIIYQKDYQQAMVDQLEAILYDLREGQFTTIADYLQNSYINGYVGVYYDLQTSHIPALVIPINQDQVVRAVKTNSKISSGLYKRLGEDVDYLKRSIRAELSRGIANGSTWNEMAAKIAKGMNSPFDRAYNNAIRIARTEGHRIQNEAALDGQRGAKNKGADIVKQWDSTLDGRTRPEHREADGQIREIDEPFEVGGEKMQAPGVGGSARNVCNCRCCLLQRAKWALDEDELKSLEERAAFFGLDKSKDFEDFRQKYLSASEEEIKKQISNVKSALEKEMLFGNDPKKIAALKEQYDSLTKNSGIMISKKSAHSSQAKNKTTNADFSAMSLNELKDYANNSLQTEFTGLSGANADYIRAAVKVIDKFEKMKSGTIKGLKVKFGGTPSGAYAKYDDTTNTIFLKKSGNMKAFEQKQLEDNIRYKLRWKTDRDYYATTSFSGTVAHELGHAVDFDTNQSLSKALSATEELDELSVKISSYAASTQNVRVSKRSEAWAENFAAYMEGGEKAKEVPEEIVKMIKDYFAKNRV